MTMIVPIADIYRNRGPTYPRGDPIKDQLYLPKDLLAHERGITTLQKAYITSTSAILQQPKRLSKNVI